MSKQATDNSQLQLSELHVPAGNAPPSYDDHGHSARDVPPTSSGHQDASQDTSQTRNGPKNEPVNPPPSAHMPQQAAYPPSQLPPQVPLNLLQSQSAPVTCPSCGTYGMTNVTPESGGFTHLIAAAVCCVTCLGCIPYCIDSLKDVHHRCTKCDMPLATFHRSGRTEIHAAMR